MYEYEEKYDLIIKYNNDPPIRLLTVKAPSIAENKNAHWVIHRACMLIDGEAHYRGPTEGVVYDGLTEDIIKDLRLLSSYTEFYDDGVTYYSGSCHFYVKANNFEVKVYKKIACSPFEEYKPIVFNSPDRILIELKAELSNAELPKVELPEAELSKRPIVWDEVNMEKRIRKSIEKYAMRIDHD